MADFDIFTFENRIRGMVQELIAPTIRRTLETHEIVEQLQKNDLENTEKLAKLDHTFNKISNKLQLVDDLYKAVQELSGNQRNNEALINLKTQSVLGELELVSLETQNLAAVTKMNEDSILALKLDFVQQIESINGLKDAILYENSVLSKKLERTREQAKEIWELLGEKVQTLNMKVEEFNQVAIPKVLAECEMMKRKVENESLEMNQRLDLLVSFEEFEKFGKSLKLEIDKAFQNFKVLAENSEKIEEYLDHYLPIENWGMISEAISSLDPKILTGFVDYDKQKFDTLKSEFDFDYLDIDGLSKRALDAYDEGLKRRETLVESIKSALKKAKKQEKKALKNLKNSTKSQSKQKPPKPVLLQTNIAPTSKLHNPLPLISEESQIFEEAHEASARSPTLVDLTDREPVRVNFSMPSESFILKQDQTKGRKILLDAEATTNNLYFPIPSNKSSARSSRQNSIESGERSSEYSHRDFENRSQDSSPSIDPAKLEKDLEELRSAIANLENRCKELSGTCEEISERVRVEIEHFSKDLASNFEMIHGEIKILIQKNKQSRADVSKTLSDFSKDMRVREKNIERVDQQFSNISELLANLVEFSRVLHSILAQEEEDRDNLNLIGISESRSQKGYLSLKTDCISCSGNNPVVMSAFKMACINYNPSPIKYCLKTFSRKQLIHLLGTFIDESWRAATAKPPYDRVPPPTMSKGSFTSENTRRKRFNSQYLELPSLNTSKQNLNLNDTSIHSFREFKQ